jgi:hypothetical protein
MEEKESGDLIFASPRLRGEERAALSQRKNQSFKNSLAL